MAQILVVGTDVFVNFTGGQGLGPTNYADYSQDLDTSLLSLLNGHNELANEVRGLQGPNQVIPLDLLQLNDILGIGAISDIVIGVESYAASFVNTSTVQVRSGKAIVLNQRVAAASNVNLSPVTGTDDGGTDYAYIALDANGQITINSAPASQALDLWRVEITAGPLFANNIQRVGVWKYGMDADAWVEQCDASGLGSTDTFTAQLFDEPKTRINRVERLLSGFTTDLQPTPETIGPIVIPGGSAAAPGLVPGDGTGTNDTTTGFYRPGLNRIGAASAGVQSLELDAVGNLDLPLNMRVKGRKTAAQTIADGGALASVTFPQADVFDIGAWHDPGGGSPENFVVPTDGAGTYLIIANLEWDEAVTNERELVMEIQLGGAVIPGGRIARRLQIDEDHSATWSVVAVLAATNVVRVQASQDDTVGALGLDIIDASLSILKVA